MKTKHTPGPWKIDNTGVLTNSKGNRVFATVYVARPTVESEYFDKWQANARLIAAAPDLLEALKAVYNRLGSGDTSGQHILYSDSLAPDSDEFTFTEYIGQAIAAAE